MHSFSPQLKYNILNVRDLFFHFFYSSHCVVPTEIALTIDYLIEFSQFIVIHTVKGCGIVNKAEIDVFLEKLESLESSNAVFF